MAAPMFTRAVAPGRACRLCFMSRRQLRSGIGIRMERIAPPSPGVFEVDACPVCDQSPVDAPPHETRRSP